jgi:hypothetical protein
MNVMMHFASWRRKIARRKPLKPFLTRLLVQKSLTQEDSHGLSPLLDSSLIYTAQELAQRYAEPGRNRQQRFERWNTMASFYEAYGCSVKSTMVRESFLA